MKSVYEYANFREFLRDRYVFEKARNKKFSFRFFARTAGFKSHGFLKLVMDGKVNLSAKSAAQLAIALKLGEEDTAFFCDLVQFNQAETGEEKNLYAQKMLRYQKYRKIHPIGEAQYNYYAHWYFVPIRELVGMASFRNDPAWIASQIEPSINPREAKKALKALLKMGLIAQEPDGKLSVANPYINTNDEVSSHSVAQFHREMMKKASESIDRVPRSEREISSVTLGISAETAKKVKAKIQEFRQELMNFISQESTKSEIVYQLNFQYFPLSRTPKGGSS